MNPKVIITGFPHSGTSFVAEVVYELGFSFGVLKNLKGYNNMNIRGHWEHLGIRDLLWDNLRESEGLTGGMNPCRTELYKHVNDIPREDLKLKVAQIAEAENIQAYKDTYYPILFNYFPQVDRIIWVERGTKATMDSPGRHGMEPHAGNLETMALAKAQWSSLMEQLSQKIPTLPVHYECFENPITFKFTIGTIAAFLGVNLTEEMLERCQGIFIPTSQR